MQQLDEHFGFRKPARGKHKSLDPVKAEVETVLSLIAYVEHADDNDASNAFAAGVAEAEIPTLNLLGRKDIKLELLNRALDNLAQLKPLVKPRLLKACIAIILQDGQTTVRGMELVRTISTCLDCPIPPVPPPV